MFSVQLKSSYGVDKNERFVGNMNIYLRGVAKFL